GTGAISILFHSFPYGEGSDALRILSYFFFFMNLVLFVTFCIISLARYTLFPDIWQLMLSHPVQSLYLGTFPMGATTLINVAVSLIYQGDGFGGQGFLYLLWGFWWIDVVLSFLCAWGLVHVMKTRQDHALSRMTAVWLLPVVTLIVGSSTGGVIAPALYPISTSHALITIATSIFMVSVGLCLAFMMLTIYLLRLIVHGLPPGATIISSFMPLGPMAQAGYSILLVGQNLQEILPLRSSTPSVLTSESAGDIVNVICVCIGFVLWALASMWMVFAVMGIYEVSRRNSFPFKLPFWGLIFPNGVYANLTIALYRTLDSPFFRIWGVIYAVATMLLWSWASNGAPTICLSNSTAFWHFTWAWHTVIMGTGVLSTLAHGFPYGTGSTVLRVFFMFFFMLNFALFLLISGATIARYVMFPEVWGLMLRHPAQSMFMGALPMGAATLINAALITYQEWGWGDKHYLYAIWGFWWIDSLHSLQKMTAVWLLPVVSLIVASSSGANIAPALRPHNDTLAILTSGFSFTMVIIGLSFAIMMISIYLLRLICFGPPDVGMILSAFIALGPLGQGGYSLLMGKIPFAMAYWGLIFPNGVFAMLSVKLATVLDSGFFRVFGAFWSTVVFVIWVVVTVQTIPAVIDGTIFSAPYLSDSIATPAPAPALANEDKFSAPPPSHCQGDEKSMC
ncbi:hypothetical protein JAAARDRAFT_130281, partial [Jaapia argillacea MUCL 33604]